GRDRVDVAAIKNSDNRPPPAWETEKRQPAARSINYLFHFQTFQSQTKVHSFTLMAIEFVFIAAPDLGKKVMNYRLWRRAGLGGERSRPVVLPRLALLRVPYSRCSSGSDRIHLRENESREGKAIGASATVEAAVSAAAVTLQAARLPPQILARGQRPRLRGED